MKYTCLVFAEGGQDKKFLISLLGLRKFQDHTKSWEFNYDSASGCSPRVILGQCRGALAGRSYDLVLCFIDLDKLKDDFPSSWPKKKEILEQEFSAFKIIWMIDKAEDEYRRVLGAMHCSKSRVNSLARQRIKEFINSDFWKRILEPIRDREKELDDRN